MSAGGKDPIKRPLSWGEREEQRRRRVPRGGSRRARVIRGWGAFKHLLGVRAVIEVEGVRYRERSTVSLRRALSDAGSGVKEYRVRFVVGAQRETMKIRATRVRIFDDLSADPRAMMYRQIVGLVRPGSRVLELGCGTGGGSRVLSECAGPSGGVVAINGDGESVRFARQRYRLLNTGFEMGWIETLGGEIDGAFDVVCVVDPMRAEADETKRPAVMRELMRVISPGGTMVVIGSPNVPGVDRSSIPAWMERAGCRGARALDASRCPGWEGFVGTKEGKKATGGTRKDPPEGSW